MAHFSKIGMNGKVIAVHVVDNENILNADGVEDETVGQQYLERHNNWPSQMWIQTSYNTRGGKHYDNKTGELSEDQSKALRGNYAGKGMIWDEDNNIFYPKKPYASWVLNTTTATWHSPIGDAPDLTDDQEENDSYYEWNEDSQTWDLITL
jgi:hypothetical protein